MGASTCSLSCIAGQAAPSLFHPLLCPVPPQGVSNKNYTCETCGQKMTDCAGHFGGCPPLPLLLPRPDTSVGALCATPSSALGVEGWMSIPTRHEHLEWETDQGTKNIRLVPALASP